MKFLVVFKPVDSTDPTNSVQFEVEAANAESAVAEVEMLLYEPVHWERVSVAEVKE